MALELRFSDFATQLQGDRDTGNPEEVSLRSTMAVIGARHHFGDGYSAQVSVPSGTVRFDPGRGVRAGWLSALGDIELAGRYDLAALWGVGGYRPSVALHLGVGLPTGTQVRIGEMGGSFPPNQLSIGSAAFSVNGRIEVVESVHRMVAIRAWSGVRRPLTPTPNGVKFGTSITYGGGALLTPLDGLMVGAQLAAQHRTPSEELAEGRILNSGGDWLAAEIIVAARLGSRLALSLTGRAPFRSKVNGTQISETYSLAAGLAVRMGADDEEDEHDHGDEHQHGGEHEESHETHHGEGEHGSGSPAPTPGDVIDAATGGDSFALADVLVPGKVTVIDFWAEWCAPCHDIDALLRRLAAEHPEALAVRRVEVPDLDSAAASEHLSGVTGLPVVWIYGTDGARVRALTATDPLAVEALLGMMLTSTPPEHGGHDEQHGH